MPDEERVVQAALRLASDVAEGRDAAARELVAFHIATETELWRRQSDLVKIALKFMVPLLLLYHVITVHACPPAKSWLKLVSK